MKRKNRILKIKALYVVAYIISVVIIAHNKPKQQTEPKQEQEQNVIYQPETITYRYSCCWSEGSLRHCPKHKVKGEEYKRINDMK